MSTQSGLVLQAEVFNSHTVKQNLCRQIVSTVLWSESMQACVTPENAGTVEFVEIGPGRVLASLVSANVKDTVPFSCTSLDI